LGIELIHHQGALSLKYSRIGFASARTRTVGIERVSSGPGRLPRLPLCADVFSSNQAAQVSLMVLLKDGVAMNVSTNLGGPTWSSGDQPPRPASYSICTTPQVNSIKVGISSRIAAVRICMKHN
jgi:hypothetical protein